MPKIWKNKGASHTKQLSVVASLPSWDAVFLVGYRIVKKINRRGASLVHVNVG